MLYADFNFLEDNNIIYSVDMLRLKTDITYEKFSYIIYMLKSCYNDSIKKYYNSFNIGDFKENYVFEVGEGSTYWLGYMHNAQSCKNGAVSNSNTKHNLTIEFNPNKVKINGFLKFLLSFIPANLWVIKSCDFSMDLKINILDLCGFDKKRYKDLRIFDCGYDNKTYYLGRTDNRIKIYNKAIESNLSYNLTRVEVSKKLDLRVPEVNMFDLKLNLPEIYTNNYIFSFSDYKDSTFLAVLYAVQSGFPLNNLTRRYKEKLKTTLTGGYKVELNKKYCLNVLRKCIWSIFDFNGGY